MFVPRFNDKIIIFVIVLLVLLDFTAVRSIAYDKVKLSSSYRAENQFGLIKAFVDQINQDSSPKIVLVGDSIIYGGGVASGEETIANYLNDLITRNHYDYHVYNLGLSGAAPADAYFVLKSLNLSKNDIVIYDLNIGHFGTKRPITFPDITPKLASKYHNGESLYHQLGMKSDELEDSLQTFMLDHWKLYAYRDVIKGEFNEKLLGIPDRETKIKVTPWNTSDWTEKTKNAAKRGNFTLTSDNASLSFLKYMMEMAKQSEAAFFVFNIPLNQEMMQKYNMIERERYAQNLDTIKNVILEEGALYKDYETLIPSDLFSDSLHPLKGGNQILADVIFQDISSLLNRGVK